MLPWGAFPLQVLGWLWGAGQTVDAVTVYAWHRAGSAPAVGHLAFLKHRALGSCGKHSGQRCEF